MSTQRTPEHCRQAWLHHFLERVVLPPCEIRGIDQANAAKAFVGSRMSAIGRGCKSGTADHWVFQGNPTVVVPIEIKHNTKPTDAQIGTANALSRCGLYVIRECRTTHEALLGLVNAGVRLHANAMNLAVEYQARMDAGLRELAAGPKKASKPRPQRDSSSRTRKWAAVQLRAAQAGRGG